MAESIGHEVVAPNGFRVRVFPKASGGYRINLGEVKRWHRLLIWSAIISTFISVGYIIFTKEEAPLGVVIFIPVVAKLLLRQATRLDIDEARLVWDGDWGICKNTAVFPKDEITDVTVTDIRARRSNPPVVIGHNVWMRLQSGRSIVLVRSVENKTHARWLADLIRSGLGFEAHTESQA